MKKILLLLVISLVLFSCEKENISSEPAGLELSFSDYRQMKTAIVIDDSITKSTTVNFSGSSMTFNWAAGYQSLILRETRLIAAQPQTGTMIIIVGVSDIAYSKIIVLKDNHLSEFYDANMVTIVKSKLDGDNLWFKYNNTWIRTAKLDDEEKNFKI